MERTVAGLLAAPDSGQKKKSRVGGRGMLWELARNLHFILHPQGNTGASGCLSIPEYNIGES